MTLSHKRLGGNLTRQTFLTENAHTVASCCVLQSYPTCFEKFATDLTLCLYAIIHRYPPVLRPKYFISRAVGDNNLLPLANHREPLS